MNKLLQTLLQQHKISDAQQTQLGSFLAAVSAQLNDVEQQKTLLERSLELTSEELIDRFDRLESSVDLFDATFNAARDAMLVSDVDTDVVRFNDEFSQMWGFPKALGNEVESLCCLQIMCPQVLDPKGVSNLLDTTASDASNNTGEVVLKDGRVIEYERRTRFSQGKPIGQLYCLNDVTQIRQSQQALEQSQADLVLAHHLANMGSWSYDQTSKALTLSPELLRLLKVPVKESVWPLSKYLKCVHEFDRDKVIALISESLKYKSLFQIEHRLLLADNTEHHVIVRGGYEENTHGNRPRLLGLLQDVTQDKDFIEKMKLSSQFFHSSLQGNILMDRKRRILDFNKVAAHIFALSTHEFKQGISQRLSTALSDALTIKGIWRHVFEHSRWAGEVNFADPELAHKTLWLSLEAYRNEDGRITHFIAIFNDISDSKIAQKQLKQLAYFDPQTQLPNRAQFEDYLSAELPLKANSQPLVLMYLDLDRFKYVNDSLGHHVGDELLCGVADRLQKTLPDSNMIARQGGDEFVIVLDKPASKAAIEVLADRILASLLAPFYLRGNQIFVGASIGIVVLPEQVNDLVTAMKYADIALYKAKNAGKGCYRFWDNAFLRDATPARMSLESALRAGIKRDELILHYQPLVDAVTGEIHSIEALVRWQHPVEGLIPPDEFIPIAEETNLILDIDEWVIREVARQQCQWKRLKLTLYPISINISAANISRASLVSTFSDILQQHPFLEGLLQVEVTETAMMLDPDNATLTLNSLFSMGVPSSIDDFGSGYTSLGYLKKLNANILKIDRSFISGITLDNYDRDVAKAIIALASSMSMKVVAEGVETHEQWDMLRVFGCDYLQGFYFNRPLNGQKMTQILAGKQKLLHE